MGWGGRRKDGWGEERGAEGDGRARVGEIFKTSAFAIQRPAWPTQAKNTAAA